MSSSSNTKSKTSKPWKGINDATDKPKGYALSLPASLHAKMTYISSMEPGGMSIRAQILAALAPFVDEKLKRYASKK